MRRFPPLEHAGAFDFLLAGLEIGGDARGLDRLLVGDARLFDLLARGDLGGFDCFRALDLALAHLAVRRDAGLADRALIGDLRLLDLLAGEDLRLLGLGIAGGTLTGHLGALHRAADLDLALLFEARSLALALDIQRLPLCLEVACADLDHRFLFDVVAQLPLFLDLLDDPRETFGIEAIGRIKVLQVGLVEIGDRDRFQHESVLFHHVDSGVAHALHVSAALLACISSIDISRRRPSAGPR